nr:SIMPL domain-containing protein [Nitrospiraceae bacterium]
IARAAVNAKQQAQALASSLGVKLGKIKSASPTCGRVPRYGFTMMGAKAQGPAKTPIEAGQIELKATVNIVFRIE